MEYSDSTEVIFKDESWLKKMNRRMSFALMFAIVSVLCIFLLITCIVLAVLYSRGLNKNDAMSGNTEGPKPEKYEICGDEKCLLLGLDMTRNMNKSVDPCEDFYAYACGGWQSRHPLVNNETVRNIGAHVHYKNIHSLRNALEMAHWIYSKNDAVMKTVRFYRSCMNTTAIDSLGPQPLHDLIKQYGGWSISKNYDPNVTVAQRIGRAARDLNIDSLFGIEVTADPFNSEINVLMLKESALGLKKREYYLDLDEESKKKRKEYKIFMRVVSRIFHVSPAKLTAIYEFEVKLAKILSGKSSDVALYDYIATRNKKHSGDGTINLLSLCHATGFPWPVLKEALEVLFDRQLTGNEKIIPVPEHVTFLKAIGPLYNKTNHALLADYIMWQVVRQYVGVLSDQHRLSKGFENDLLKSVNFLRWQQCINAMLQPFDMPLGLLYVKTHLNDEDRVKIKEMIENTRTSFIQRLPTQTWMDKETREMAKQKALAIAVEEIGYPSYIKDPAKLKAQYDSLHVTDSLMENMKAANHFLRMRNLKHFERPVDKKEWRFRSPVEYNGFYAPSFNKIVFLAGILQKPMYSPDYPRYVNYGAIGMVMGHEITHAFDGTGRLYDKNGNANNWWSDSSSLNFISKSDCFVEQYDKYRIFDKYADGNKTLNENIADNGGIKLAYDAYQRWTKENGSEQVLPGLQLNPNQLFFLGFAQSWCSVYSKDGAYHQLETDNHSTEKYRIIGPLSNFKPFAEAFNCPANSPMNPSNKCVIW